MAYGTITYNSITLTPQSILPTRKQATLKYKVGKQLMEFQTPTRDAFDWEIRVSGIIASDLDTIRTNLENSNDVASHAYSDGLISINCVMRPESLRFTDKSDDAGMVYRYDFTLYNTIKVR